MVADGVAVFPTAIGACALAWGDGGVVGTALPERDEASLRVRLLRRYGDLPDVAPPAFVRAAIDAVTAHLAGDLRHLREIPLADADVVPFDRAVYRALRDVEPGRTTSYGALARDLGGPPVARAVGQALGRNVWPIVVPCHRVLAADGRIGGFSAYGGTATKLRLLAVEGARAYLEPALF